MRRIEEKAPGFLGNHGVYQGPEKTNRNAKPLAFELLILKMRYRAIDDRRTVAAGDILFALYLMFVFDLLWCFF